MFPMSVKQMNITDVLYLRLGSLYIPVSYKYAQ